MNVGHIDGTSEQRCNFPWCEASDAATYLGDEEGQLRMHVGKTNELFHVGHDGVRAALHRRDGVTFALQSNALTHNGTKFLHSNTCCAASMCPGKVAAKDENLAVFKAFDVFRRDAVAEFVYLMVILGGAVFHATVGLAFFSRHSRSGGEAH